MVKKLILFCLCFLALRAAGMPLDSTVATVRQQPAPFALFNPDTRPIGLPVWMDRTHRFIYSALEENYILLGKRSPLAYGPVVSTLGGNGLEGWRVQAGLATTPFMSRHLFLSGYAAYGFRDKQFKYMGRAEWSFAPKPKGAYSYPVRSVFVQYDDDVDKIARQAVPLGGHHILLAWARHSDRRMTYRRRAMAGTVWELNRDWQFETSTAHETEYSTPEMPMVYADGRVIGSYSRARLDLKGEWTPGAYGTDRMFRRVNRTPYAPVVMLHAALSPDRWCGAPSPLVLTRVSYRQLFATGAYGSLNVVADAAHLWTATVYPSLLYPAANSSYFLRKTSFGMMLPMEFACDSYAAAFADWSPGLLWHSNWLRRNGIRELLIGRAATGVLSRRNKPECNGLLLLPAGVGTFDHWKPYVEAGIGIDGILGCLRVEYIWRLSYRDAPGISRAGLCVGIDFAL